MLVALRQRTAAAEPGVPHDRVRVRGIMGAQRAFTTWLLSQCVAPGTDTVEVMGAF
jgi:hypothetical protein